MEKSFVINGHKYSIIVCGKKMRRTPMFADKNLLFSKYEQLHNIYIQFFLLFVVCVCATTMYRRFLEYTVFGLKIAVYLKICVILKSKNPLSARLMIVSCINDLVGIQNQLSTMFPETPDFKDPLYLDNNSISCCSLHCVGKDAVTSFFAITK